MLGGAQGGGMQPDAGAFVAATVRLLRDADLRARLGAAARRLAEERYDWAALGDRLERALVGLARR